MNRCFWAEADPLLMDYHDKEWGVPLFDDVKQFEFLSLEVMQCGLSWLTVLRKREALNRAFDNFNPKSVALFDDGKIAEILQTEGVIRSERKIRAIVNNAKAFLKIQEELGSFSSFLWSFTANKTIEYPDHINEHKIVARNELSDRVSAELKKRGFSFLGSVTVYSHLQAVGVINDHFDYCFRYHECCKK